MTSIGAYDSVVASYLQSGQGHGQTLIATAASTARQTAIVDAVDLSPQGKAVLEAGLAPARSTLPTASQQDSGLLAKASLIEGLIGNDDEEDQLPLR